MKNYIPQIKDSQQLPEEWFKVFPSGREIFKFVIQILPRKDWSKSIDILLLHRREIEFSIFKKIESVNVLPNIANGFHTVEEFIKYAHSVSNRRKSRTGTSLELNLESIFIEEKLRFATQVITENKKKPDFLFPNKSAYHNPNFPCSKLTMMAAKTCCKDRWRQILNEANRITPKHLFTLQQGVSSNQLKEMKDNNVTLVVPEPHLKSFPKEWKTSLLSLENFVQYIRTQQLNIPNLNE